MRAFLKGLLAVVVGLVVGSAVNMGLILLGARVVPAPAGVDTTTSKGLAAAMPLLGPAHFVFPFLAHALGTFAGALLATWIAGRVSRVPAAVIGVLGMLPGVMLPIAMGVPITAQTLGVMLAGIILGPRHGALAVLLFLFVVLLGAPLLSGGRGGLGVLFGPSVGFLLGFVPAAFTGGAPFSLLTLATPVTYMLLHGGWMHLAMNGLMLMAFGAGVERWIGARRLLIFCLACGVISAFSHLWLNPHSDDPVIGASGALSGLFAAVLVMMNDMRSRAGAAPGERRGRHG